MERPANAFPLFKGATRTPLFMGVPLIPMILAFFIVFVLAMLVSLLCWFVIIPVYAAMRQLVKHDHRAFSTWSLWFDTALRNRNKGFWKASSYAPAIYSKRNRHGR